jgi:CO/xanthine dehydrogenase FAD-binding subunit
VVVEDGTIRWARTALGGVGTIPWRARAAEQSLVDAPAMDETFERAARAAVDGASTVPGTAFKVVLAQRTLVRILQAVVDGTP